MEKTKIAVITRNEYTFRDIVPILAGGIAHGVAVAWRANMTEAETLTTRYIGVFTDHSNVRAVFGISIDAYVVDSGTVDPEDLSPLESIVQSRLPIDVRRTFEFRVVE
jgi:hypothetical protein